MTSLLRNKVYLAIALGHFVLDVFNNSGPILVTFLSIPMALSTAQIGLAIGSYQFVGSLVQPLFGWLADRIGTRWLGPGSVTWTIGFLILSVTIARQTGSFLWFVIPFIIASLGSGAFHPLGTKHATEESGPRVATGTAVFFGFGQTGLAVGPVLTGLILTYIGIAGIYGLAVIAAPVILFMFYVMRSLQSAPAKAPRLGDLLDTNPIQPDQVVRWSPIITLALLVGLRSWAFLGTVTFLPKIFQDKAWSPISYGLITGLFWVASAITVSIAGGWADRWGRRPVVFVTMLLGSITLYFLPLYSGWQAFPLAVISGGLLGASHGILVVVGQDLLPLQKAFSSGIILGYLFGIGAIAAWGVGGLAELWGLPAVIQLGAGIGLLAALLALYLPQTRVVSPVQAERVPV